MRSRTPIAPSMIVLLVCLLVAVRAQSTARAAQPQPDHATSRIFNRALGGECMHCHADNDFKDESKPTFDFARRMEAMVRGLNAGPLADLGGVTCWSCHRGHVTPVRLAREKWQPLVTTHAGDLTGTRAGLDVTMSVYAASLGVDCSHCHVAGSWTDPSRRGYQLAGRMAKMFAFISTFFDGSTRQPSTQCFMCHQGSVHVERESGLLSSPIHSGNNTDPRLDQPRIRLGLERSSDAAATVRRGR